MWDSRLAALVGDYPTGVLSWVDPGGDPVSVRVVVELDAAAERIRFVGLPAVAKGRAGPACLLFHHHDERLEGLRQMVLKGELMTVDGEVVLAVTGFVTANGRTGTDRMPHAGAPLHMVAFYRLGRRKAQAYLKARGAPWPPIPFDEIRRAAMDEPD